MSDNDPVVSIENLDIHFDDSSMTDRLHSREKIVRAVDNVSLDIRPNDVIALVGESGCGKTTFGKAAVGLQRPTSGSVKYRGQDIWEAKAGNGTIPYEEIRRALQIIHQDPGSSLNPNRRVISTLSEPLKRWEPDLSQNEREARILAALNRVELDPAEDYASRYPHQLSGGEKQRVALIRALLMNPDLILADEAVSALDVSLRVDMMDLMLELQEMIETSFLFISHDLSNARYLAEHADGRIAIMYLGEIVEIGSAKKVLSNPRHPYTKILKWATPSLNPRIAKKQAQEDSPLRDIDIPDPLDPPSGCRFHTRCPEARKICESQQPPLCSSSETDDQQAKCFRQFDDHEYWDSPLIEETDQTIPFVHE